MNPPRGCCCVPAGFSTPQPGGNCSLGEPLTCRALFWRPGKFGVSCCCSKSPPSIKCSGMQGFCNQLLHQESALNSPILPSSPPSCRLSQRRLGVREIDTDSACGWSGGPGPIPNPQESASPPGGERREAGSQSRTGDWGGGTYGLGGSPHPKELWAPPCHESAVTRAASWAELRTVSEPLILHLQQGSRSLPQGESTCTGPLFQIRPPVSLIIGVITL